MKHLKVVVVKDNGVMLRQRGLDIRSSSSAPM